MSTHLNSSREEQQRHSNAPSNNNNNNNNNNKQKRQQQQQQQQQRQQDQQRKANNSWATKQMSSSPLLITFQNETNWFFFQSAILKICEASLQVTFNFWMMSRPFCLWRHPSIMRTFRLPFVWIHCSTVIVVSVLFNDFQLNNLIIITSAMMLLLLHYYNIVVLHIIIINNISKIIINISKIYR